MRDVTLKLIDSVQAEGRSVIEKSEGKEPYFLGKDAGAGDVNLICGNCDFVLAETVRLNMLNNVVLRCPECGAYNDTQ